MCQLYAQTRNLSTTRVILYELPHLKRFPSEPHQDSFVVPVAATGPETGWTIDIEIVVPIGVVLRDYAPGRALKFVILLHVP